MYGNVPPMVVKSTALYADVLQPWIGDDHPWYSPANAMLGGGEGGSTHCVGMTLSSSSAASNACACAVDATRRRTPALRSGSASCAMAESAGDMSITPATRRLQDKPRPGPWSIGCVAAWACDFAVSDVPVQCAGAARGRGA